MKKKIISILTLALMLSCFGGQCHHVHDEHCGYDPKTETGCTHECDDIIENRPFDRWDPED